MSGTALDHVLAIVGALLYMSAAIPALVVVLRDRHAESVNPATLDLLILSGYWWIAYSWDIRNWPSLLSTCVAVLSPTILVILKMRTKEFPFRALALIFVGLFALFILNRSSPADVGVVAAVFSLAIIVPTTWRILVRKEPAPNASVWFWIMQAVTALVWLIYGIVIGHPILGATGLIVAPLACMISLKLHEGRQAPQVSYS